jgi:hypothetical protein
MAAKNVTRWAVAGVRRQTGVGQPVRVHVPRRGHTVGEPRDSSNDDHDEALSAWLQAQPGVVTPSVTREGDAVVVTFTMWALILGTGPDVIGEANRLGYTGLGSIETRIAGGMTLW